MPRLVCAGSPAVDSWATWRRSRSIPSGDGSIEHVAFASKDVPGLVKTLTALGGKVVVGDPATGFVYVQMPNLPFILELNKAS